MRDRPEHFAPEHLAHVLLPQGVGVGGVIYDQLYLVFIVDAAAQELKSGSCVLDAGDIQTGQQQHDGSLFQGHRHQVCEPGWAVDYHEVVGLRQQREHLLHRLRANVAPVYGLKRRRQYLDPSLVLGEVAAELLPVQLVNVLGHLHEAGLNRNIKHHGGVTEDGIHVHDDSAARVHRYECRSQVGGHGRLADAALGAKDRDHHARAPCARHGLSRCQRPPALLLGESGLYGLDHLIRLERFREVVPGAGHHGPPCGFRILIG